MSATRYFLSAFFARQSLPISFLGLLSSAVLLLCSLSAQAQSFDGRLKALEKRIEALEAAIKPATPVAALSPVLKAERKLMGGRSDSLGFTLQGCRLSEVITCRFFIRKLDGGDTTSFYFNAASTKSSKWMDSVPNVYVAKRVRRIEDSRNDSIVIGTDFAAGEESVQEIDFPKPMDSSTTVMRKLQISVSISYRDQLLFYDNVPLD
jgi:hypothetical protein